MNLKHFLEAQRDFLTHYLNDPVAAAGLVARAPDAMEFRNKFDIIANRVATQFDLESGLLRRACRIRRVRDARWVAFRICHNITEATMASIARYFRCDHSNVYHGLNRVRDLMETDRKFAALVTLLEKDIRELLRIHNSKSPFAEFLAARGRVPEGIELHRPQNHNSQFATHNSKS